MILVHVGVHELDHIGTERGGEHFWEGYLTGLGAGGREDGDERAGSHF